MSFCLDTRGTVLLSMRASSVSSKYENCRFIGYAASVSLSDANYIRAQSHRETARSSEAWDDMVHKGNRLQCGESHV